MKYATFRYGTIEVETGLNAKELEGDGESSAENVT